MAETKDRFGFTLLSYLWTYESMQATRWFVQGFVDHKTSMLRCDRWKRELLGEVNKVTQTADGATTNWEGKPLLNKLTEVEFLEGFTFL